MYPVCTGSDRCPCCLYVCALRPFAWATLSLCVRVRSRAPFAGAGWGGRGGCTKTLALESVDGRVTKLNMVEPGGLCKVRQVELEVRSSSVLL